AFANPAAVQGPGAEVPSAGALALAPRIACIIGAEGGLAAFTILAEWRDPTRRVPKDRDFALGLGPVVVTNGAFDPDACLQLVRVNGGECLRQPSPPFAWNEAVSLAAERTRLYPGDVLAGPAGGLAAEIGPGSSVEIEVDGIGVLEHRTG